MHTFKRLVLATVLAAGAAVGAASPVLSAPPTDEQVDAYIAKVAEAGKSSTDRAESMKAMKKAAEEGIGGISLSEASVAQLQKLSKAGLFSRLPDTRNAVAPRLAELAKQTDLDGARAALMRVAAYPDSDDRTPEGRRARQLAIADAYKQALTHPAVAELLKSEREGNELFARLGSFDGDTIREAKLIDAIEPLLANDLEPGVAASTVGVFDTIAEDEKSDAAVKERIRTKVIAAIQKSVASAPKAEGGGETPVVKYLNRSLAYLDGPHAKGLLIDHPAPAMTFNWATDPKLKSLADLKGRVIVVDFWATWCGPCVASFPNVRELQKRYEGYPVTILGVTSLQGYSMDRSEKPAKRIDTKDDPAKEKELMTAFVNQLDMTWQVAFSDQEVFNPAYGVRGIPHVAIIDPAGKVRHNGLHPGAALPDKAKKIDALLKEAGLPCPAPMPEEEKKEGQ